VDGRRRVSFVGRRHHIASWALFLLAGVSAGAIGALMLWGGRIEATLLVFGDPVFLVVDGGGPRTVLLPALPLLLAGTAFYVRTRLE
jgi:hypothetical protein